MNFLKISWLVPTIVLATLIFVLFMGIIQYSKNGNANRINISIFELAE